MSLTVACVFVSGHVPFTPEYVVRLRSACERSLPPHRFVCLTNREHELPEDGIEIVPIEPHRGIFGWWSKVELFNRSMPFTGRCLYLDLDVLLVGDMEPIIEFPAEFALVPDGAPNFQPKDGKSVVKRFNSSVMVWDYGVGHEIHDLWTHKIAARLWGDQDWIGEVCPKAATMPAEWFPRLSQLGCAPSWTPHAKVVLCKKPKNVEAAARYPWFNEAWQ